MAENEGITATEGQAPEGTGTEGTQVPANAGTGNQPDEITTLRSRAAGLDAKVTELTKAQKAAEAKAAEALQKLADYEAGKVGADEALRAQLAAKEAELEQARKERALARIEAKYPETFGVLGDAAANLTEDVLAANEARLQGQAAATEPPTPQRNNPNKDKTATKEAEITSEDLVAQLRTMERPW